MWISENPTSIANGSVGREDEVVVFVNVVGPWLQDWLFGEGMSTEGGLYETLIEVDYNTGNIVDNFFFLDVLVNSKVTIFHLLYASLTKAFAAASGALLK